MAHQVQIHDGVMEMVINFSGTVAQANDPLIIEFETHVRRLEAAFDLKCLIVTETSPSVYDYTVETDGGREVLGVIDFSIDPANPTLTGSATGGGWSIEELQPFRECRDAWIAIQNKIGGIGFAVEVF